MVFVLYKKDKNKHKNKKTNQKHEIMKNLTQVVRDEQKLKLMNFIDYLPALIVNIFSVLFSTSIILELRGVVNGWVLVLLSVFIIYFLIQNEVFKVKYIRKVFKGNKNALLPFVGTFVLSVSLATMGMYFYTNKSNQIRDLGTLDKSEQLNQIRQKYQIQIDNINNLSYETSKSYEALQTELKYWKKASANDVSERSEIRKHVDNIQIDISKQRDLFNTDKNSRINGLNNLMLSETTIAENKFTNKVNKSKTVDFISYVLLALILITEFSTIILNKNVVEKHAVIEQLIDSKLAKTYIIASNILSSLYMTSKDGWISINNAKYSYANKDNVLSWDEIKQIYNNFISLGVLVDSDIRIHNDIATGEEKKVLFNRLALNETEAQDKLNQYFDRFMRM